MKQYKGMYIIRPDLTEEQYKLVIEEINKIFTDNQSTVTKVDVWGLRELAYEINDFKTMFCLSASVKSFASLSSLFFGLKFLNSCCVTFKCFP